MGMVMVVRVLCSLENNSFDCVPQHRRHPTISRLNPLRSTLPQATFHRQHRQLRVMHNRPRLRIDIPRRHRPLCLQHTITVHTVNQAPSLNTRRLMGHHRMQHHRRPMLHLRRSHQLSRLFLLRRKYPSLQRGPKCRTPMTHLYYRQNHGKRRPTLVHTGSTELTSLLLPHRPSHRGRLQEQLLRHHPREGPRRLPGRLLHRA